MKSLRLSIALLCMGLAGCSLPFLSQKKAIEEFPQMEVEEEVVAEEVYESAEKIVENEENVDETIWNTEKVGEEAPILKDLEASVFEGESIDKLEVFSEEEVVEEDLIIGGLIPGDEEKEFVEVEVTSFNLQASDKEVLAEEKESDLTEELLEEEIEQVLEEEEVLETISEEVEMPVIEIEKEEEIVIEDIEIPAGALPSTGSPSPLASLWGWVKSWF